MDIAAASMNIASVNQGSAVSMSLIKKAMDTEAMQAQALTDMLQKATVPSPDHLGNVVDTYA